MAKSSLHIFLLDTPLYCGWEEKKGKEKVGCGGYERNSINHTKRQGKTREGRNRKRRAEDWGVVAVHRTINQHHSTGLGLSLYACTHIHTSVSPIIKCPVVRVSDYKVPNWLFGQ